MFLSWHFFDMRLPHKTVAKGIDVEIRRRTSTFEPPHSYRLAWRADCAFGVASDARADGRGTWLALLIEVADASREELKFLLEGVRRLGFAGINVTFPYKEAVLDLLDELSPSAAMVGAVNTVVVRDGRLIGYNTDTTGFARAVSGLVTASAHGAVALIGAGGVGKAIAFALAGLGVNELRIFASEHAKAPHLAAQLQG